MAKFIRAFCVLILAAQIAAAEDGSADTAASLKPRAPEVGDVITVHIDRGAAATARKETASKTGVGLAPLEEMSACIVEVRSNGTLLIDGCSELIRGDEVCEHTISGEVPMKAVHPDGSVSSTDIANLRVKIHKRSAIQDDLVQPTAAQQDANDVRPSPELDKTVVLREKQHELTRLQQEIHQLREETGSQQQIVVRVQMLEVSLTKLRRMKTDFSVADLIGTTQDGAQAISKVGQTTDSKALIGFLEWLKENNVARVLAEPQVMTMDGRPASVHIGGEIPLPSGCNKDAVEYKNVGTQLDVVPVALGGNRVRLEMRARVSEVDDSHSLVIGESRVPAFTVRQCAMAIETAFGCSAVCNGLVEVRTESVKTETGTRAERNEVALLLVVTPELADAVAKAPRPVPYSPAK
jgi:Bacterial type II and III secretion system protein/Flagellar L-ring protein